MNFLRDLVFGRWLTVTRYAVAIAIILVARTGQAFACLAVPGGDTSTNYEKLLLDCNKMIQTSPNLAMGYGNRAIAYLYGKGNFDQAVADASKCISLFDMHPDLNQMRIILAVCHMTKGDALLKLGQFDDAVAALKFAVDMQSGAGRGFQSHLNAGLLARADFLLATGDYEGAIRDYNTVAQRCILGRTIFKPAGNSLGSISVWQRPMRRKAICRRQLASIRH